MATRTVPSELYPTIAAALAVANAGDTISIAGGDYPANLTIDKRITLKGAGIGLTRIISASGTKPVITVTASGQDANNRLVISDLKVMGAIGTENTGAGILFSPTSAGSYYTVENVESFNNQGAGIAFNATVAISDVKIYSSTLSTNGSAGLRIASAIPSFNGLDMSGCSLINNKGSGFVSNPSGSNVVNTNFTFTNCAVSNNNVNNGAGNHQMSFFGFKGVATLTGVTVTSAAAATSAVNQAHGIAFTANAGSSTGAQFAVAGPSDNITLTNVTVTGNYFRSALLFQSYTDMTKVVFSGVNVKGRVPTVGTTWGDIAITHTGAVALQLGNTSLKTLSLGGSGGVDATTAVFYDAAAPANVLSKSVDADCYKIATQITDKMFGTNEIFTGLGRLGLVSFKSNNIYVRAPLGATPTGQSLITDVINKAIGLAVAGDTVNVAAGSYSGEQLLINKAITVKGAGRTLTTYTHTGGSVSVIMSKSGAELRDMKIQKPDANTASVISVQRESRDIDSTGCKLINVETGSSTGTKLERGVAINGVSDVTVEGCVFSETTKSYTLGLASVKGITLSGCTIPASAYGSVGIFTTTNEAYISALADPSTSGIDLSATTNSWTGNVYSSNAGGVINIQPASYASYKLAGAAGSAVVTLPAAFHYAYLQQVRSATNADIGAQNVSISHARFLGNAMFYEMLQASAGPTNRVVLFGRDLTDNKVFFDSIFNTAENIVYGGAAETAATLSAALSTANTSAAAISVAAATAASSTLSSINYSSSTVSEAQATIKAAAATVLTAALASSSLAGASTAVELVKAANTNFKSAPVAIAEKNGVAEAVENLPPVSLSASDAVSLFAALKSANVDTAITSGKTVEFTPAKSVVVSGVTKRYIIKPSSPSTISVDYTPMISGESYNLLLDTEVVGGVPTEPVGQTISQIKYEGDKLYFRTSSAASYTEISLGGSYVIMRDGVSYKYAVCAIGGVTSITSDMPCLPAGQRILTASGWRPVEELRNGDIVITDTGAAVPAKICSTTIITTSNSAPINIPASLFGKSGPPVRLSPGHAVRMRKGVWEFPYRLLRSRSGVTQDAPGEKVTYYHVILPNFLRDNLVLEGGAVAESFGAPFAKANGLNGAKIYTFNKNLGGYTRMAHGAVKTA
jgi:hypothetical protein